MLSKLAAFWSGRLTAAEAGRQLGQQLCALTPDLAWVFDDRRGGPCSLALPDRIAVTLADRGDGVEARVVVPGQPGDDDAPILLRAAYDVTNLAHSLSWRARIAPGAVVLQALRANAVYEVVRAFTDDNGRAFAAGTRLTFVQRQFSPYHGGHTLCFREATIYVREESEVGRAFGDYFAYARAQ